MVLLEEYYELDEADDVSCRWKAIQILVYVCAGLFSIWCGFTLAWVRQAFGANCHLFAGDVKFYDGKNELDITKIPWGSESLCEYCQYSMISSFIFATIWATFFLMCGNGGKSVTGLPQPWRIVVPALVFNLVYLIIAFVAALKLEQGTAQFCNNFEAQLKLLNSSYSGIGCDDLNNFLTSEQNTSLHLEMVISTSWVCVGSWLLAFLLPFLRIIFVSDFQIYKVSVYKMDNEEIHKHNDEIKVEQSVKSFEKKPLHTVVTQAQMHAGSDTDSSETQMTAVRSKTDLTFSDEDLPFIADLEENEESDEGESTLNLTNYEEAGPSGNATSDKGSTSFRKQRKIGSKPQPVNKSIPRSMGILKKRKDVRSMPPPGDGNQ